MAPDIADALKPWQFDPLVWCGALVAAALYAWGVRGYNRRRSAPWPATRSLWYGAGIVSALVAIESPLDAAGDVAFAPHMVQHIILTDITAPLLLLGAPLLLFLASTPAPVARRFVGGMRSRVGRIIGSPVLSWSVFIITLWFVHYGGFFEAALRNETLHEAEHALFIGTALYFWLPIIAIGPTPWMTGPLAHPLRMLYLLVAMPAEGMLGFTINGARHVLYPSYAAAGLGDQQSAGEIMWIGSGLCMFVAFMIAGWGWAQHEQQLGVRVDARLAAEARWAGGER